MKFSMFKVSSGLLVLAAAATVVLASANAGYNGSPRNYNQRNLPRANSNTVGRYQCQGYNCNNNIINNNNRHPFGPYHTYAVRPKPAYYGGRGLYYYRGYVRQAAGGRQHRPRNQRYNNRGCYGPNCNNIYGRNNRRPARPQGYKASVAKNLNGLRPVNVLVIPAPSKANYQAGYNSNSKQPYGPPAGNSNNVYNKGDGHNNRKNAPLRNAGGY